jgi:hypothetical protein
MPRTKSKPKPKEVPVAPIARFLRKADVPKTEVRLPGGPRELALVPFMRVGNQARSFGKKDLRELGLSLEELGEMVLAGVREEVPVRVRSAGDGIYTVSNEKIPFVSAWALMLGEVKGLPKIGPKGALVTMPNPQLLAVRPMKKTGLRAAIEHLIPSTISAFNESAEPLSPDLYWVRGDDWQRIRIEVRGFQLRVHLTEELEDELGEV